MDRWPLTNDDDHHRRHYHFTMASPLVTRIPTCLSCLRRIAQPVNTSLLTQVRGKKTNSRLNKDAGVVVRLLTDIKGFGKEGKKVGYMHGIFLFSFWVL